jgi:hypothetical protein
LIDIGLASEHLVCSDLAFQGYKVSLAPQMCSYDLIVDVNGLLLRVQVKATAGQYFWNNTKAPKYRFRLQKGGGNVARHKKQHRKNYDPSEVDIFALVAGDSKVIAYIPVTGPITNCLEFYPTSDNRRSTSRVITEFPFDKALEKLLESKAA